MISLRLARKCKIEFNESFKPVRLADGTLSKRFYGTTNLVTVKVKETKCKLNLIVIDSHIDMLLGLDWFNKTNAILTPSTKSLTFINNEENEDEDLDKSLFLVENSLSKENQESDYDEDICWNDIEEFDLKNFTKMKELNTEQNKKFIKLMSSYKECFASDLSQLAEPCVSEKHIIRTTSEVPLFQTPYRRPKHHDEIIESEVEKMKKYGIIRDSKIPWSSQPVLNIRNQIILRDFA